MLEFWKQETTIFVNSTIYILLTIDESIWFNYLILLL
uniref:Uncharacterized protein n=1 Tax=Rhizophora mucronata TaxID=61149 RepID=A0A2P2IRQ4_RHIMU